MGYGRKGKGSTLDLLTDGQGLPIALEITAANVHETKPVLEPISK